MFNTLGDQIFHSRTLTEKQIVSMIFSITHSKSSSPFLNFEYIYVLSTLLDFG